MEGGEGRAYTFVAEELHSARYYIDQNQDKLFYFHKDSFADIYIFYLLQSLSHNFYQCT